jgi:DNA replication protein DnaD
MNTHTGWIKLYRCLLDDPIWQCSTNEQKVILITLLLMANHAEKKWQWNGMPYHCQPGQMITSLNSIQQKCGKHISHRNIRTALKRFETFGFLTNQSTKHNRLITICNWDIYQNTLDKDDKPTGNQPTDARQSPDHHLTPNKNVKNVKNEKNLSLREEISFKDNINEDPLLQDTLRKAKEYEDAQNRIRNLFHQRNPQTLAPLDAERR